MKLTRRALIVAAGALPFTTALSQAKQSLPKSYSHSTLGRKLPDKAAFLTNGLTYLDSGSQHPIPISSKREVESYLTKRMLDPTAASYQWPERAVRAKFAKLINAKDHDEIGYVQSTTIGEQMVLRSLGFPHSRGHIVTDTLHFFGSFPTYEEMARQGAEVTWVRMKDGRIALSDMKKAIRKDTKLVALSSVSTFNGFQHDLKAVCDLAHENGALVYADIIHSAGCVPIDVSEAGVDFAACASYKWLMGDFGLGFIYARKATQRHLLRTEFGYETLSAFRTHVYPLDPPGPTVADYAWRKDTAGHFAHATQSYHVVALLDRSLDYILGLGVAAIQAHAQQLISQLRKELPRLGYTVLTPPETTSPLFTCLFKDAYLRLPHRLRSQGVIITARRNDFRVSPSVFNEERDIERFLSVLGRAPA
jgi:selenocysteine lyase/cysteine desulfurase